MKTGLFFGSFNPVHVGHLAIANFMVEFTDIDQIWFVLSPHNPFKKKSTLLPDYTRLDLLNLAIDDDPRFKSSNIEFKLPKPSYTIDTLTYLKDQFPKKDFVLIMGSDILCSFHKWKNYEQIEQNYKRYIYPRSTNEKIDKQQHVNVEFVNAPIIEISSSFIRDALKHGKDIRHFLPSKVFGIIDKMGYYR